MQPQPTKHIPLSWQKICSGCKILLTACNSIHCIKFLISDIIKQKDLAVLGEMLNAAVDPQTFPRCIIFCKRKEVVSNVFQFLRHCARKREFVAMYHASLTENTKKEIYDQFANPFSHIRCLVATIAFGMVS